MKVVVSVWSGGGSIRRSLPEIFSRFGAKIFNLRADKQATDISTTFAAKNIFAIYAQLQEKSPSLKIIRIPNFQ